MVQGKFIVKAVAREYITSMKSKPKSCSRGFHSFSRPGKGSLTWVQELAIPLLWCCSGQTWLSLSCHYAPWLQRRASERCREGQLGARRGAQVGRIGSQKLVSWLTAFFALPELAVRPGTGSIACCRSFVPSHDNKKIQKQR